MEVIGSVRSFSDASGLHATAEDVLLIGNVVWFQEAVDGSNEAVDVNR